MFDINRTFSSRNPDTGVMEWFFNAREGIFGPYSSEEGATKDLKDFIKNCFEKGDDGGRTKPVQTQLSLMPKDSSMAGKHYHPLKQKKGIESL